jgi:stage III sporulation protein AF
MREFLSNWIINIVSIALILILFEIVMPNGKTKKIINLVAGFILIIAVINPFIAIKNKGIDLGEMALQDSSYIDKKEIEASSKVLDQKQMKQINEVYKKKLIEKISEETSKIEGVSECNVNVEINEDTDSKNYGEIKKVFIELKKGKSKDKEALKIRSVASVKKVEISTKSKKDANKKPNNLTDVETKRLSDTVKQSLNKSFEIQKENIIVSVL